MTGAIFFLGCHANSRLADQVVRSLARELGVGPRGPAVLSALDPMGGRGTLVDLTETVIPYPPAEMQSFTRDEAEELAASLLPRHSAVVAACRLAGAGELPQAWVSVADHFLLLLPSDRSAVVQVQEWLTAWRDQGLPRPHLLVEEPDLPGDNLPPEEVAGHLGLDLLAVIHPEAAAPDAGLQRRLELRARLQVALAVDHSPARERDGIDADALLVAGTPTGSAAPVLSPDGISGTEARSGAEPASDEATVSMVEQVRLLEELERQRRETVQEKQAQSAAVAETLARLRAAAREQEADLELIQLARQLIAAVTHLEALERRETRLTAQMRELALMVRRWLEGLVEVSPGRPVDEWVE
ncbi:MAG: hypothetical protein DIU70_001795 [Bacillota bacterium]|nr:MAG: hypothetical protein DIU70_00695 [Bacillota bacterium]